MVGLKSSPRILEKGVNLCFKNARTLIKDAKLLIDNQSFGHALFLVITSIEEISKALIYASSRLESRKIEKLREVYRHDEKFGYHLGSLLAQLIVMHGKVEKEYEAEPLDIDDFFLLAEDAKSCIYDMLVHREWSLYVDYEDGEWYSPFDIKLEDVTTMVTFAESYLKDAEKRCEHLLSVPSDVLTQLIEYIEKQLAPSYLEQLYKEKRITKEVYLLIKESLEEDKAQNPISGSSRA